MRDPERTVRSNEAGFTWGTMVLTDSAGIGAAPPLLAI